MTEPKVVLDASAVLALLKQEPGHQLVFATLPGALLSAVNLAEVLSKLNEDGWPESDAKTILSSLGIVVVAFNEAQAYLTARLRPVTRFAGLSTGDRACLALAQARGAVAMTADRAWLRVAPMTGISVVDIRSG
jgi:ribonuclease VapC